MKILIFGNTKLTELCCKFLLENTSHDIIGYVANRGKNLVNGDMSFLKKIDNPFDTEFDIFISIQYDRIIKNVNKGFNLHTGLLPEWGGRDIFYYTIQEKAKEQGLTFHKMSKELDQGPIISKITYPVISNDDESNLYDKQLLISPSFLISCLDLLPYVFNDINTIAPLEPRKFKRGDIPEKSKEHYIKIGNKIKEKWSS